MWKLRSCVFGLALTAAAVVSTSAVADGFKRGSGQPPIRWSGFYLGAHWAHAWIDTDASSNLVQPPLVINQTVSDRQSGGGVEAGYNFQAGNFVYGVAVDWTSVRSDALGIIDTANQDEIYRAKIDSLGTARLRLGYALGHWMPYITGGVAWSRIGVGYENYTDATRTVLTETSVKSETKAGWVLGLGMDFAINQHLIGKVEYLHADFGRIDVADVFVGTPAFSGRFSSEVDIFKLGLAWKF